MKLKRKFPLGMNVVQAARQRIKNVFANGLPVVLAFSGGKDSICLDYLVYELCASGQVDKNLLTVVFIDEEAIYPCVERTVLKTRTKWLSIGVRFDWFALEFKHYNCLNALAQDETFICFDRTKRDRWIRNPPPFAIQEHPLLVPGKDTYQSFLIKLHKNCVSMIGVRASESIQRQQSLYAQDWKTSSRVFPIYDWTDKDVWLFLKDNNIDIPDAYLYMWQCGTPKNRLRISQFFSIDTCRNLVNMCEYYPDLFDKICRREPNAYMAMLYFDTEMFRRAKRAPDDKKSEDVNYRETVLRIMRRPQDYNVDPNGNSYAWIKKLLLRFAHEFDVASWKQAYEILVAGDPKLRTFRALFVNLMAKASREAESNG